MSAIDEDLIRALQLDGRAQFSSLAAQLGTHRAVVAQRVQELLASGEISIRAAVHPSALGLPVQVNLLLRISGPTTPVFEHLMQHGNAVFISEITGPFQGVVELWASDWAEAARLVAAVRAIDGVMEVQLSLYEHVLRRLRLADDPRVADLSFDDFDIELMAQLQLDGRLTFGELGRLTGRSASACRTRVMRLRETNAMRIGAVRSRRSVTSSVLAGVGIILIGDDEAHSAVERLLVDIPSIEFAARTMGRYSLLATIAARSLADYSAIIRRIREQPGVHVAETWIHASLWSERYEWSFDRLRSR